MGIPYRCPVCDGRGLVPNGFYRSVGVSDWGSSSVSPEKCKSCDGTGVVWGSLSYTPQFLTPFPEGIKPLPFPPLPPDLNCTAETKDRTTDTKESNEQSGRKDQ